MKYLSVSGISEMHDILLSKKSGKVFVSYRSCCFSGDYTLLRNYKYKLLQLCSDILPYEPITLSSEKLRQLIKQHRRYIKCDIPIYCLPTFLQQSSQPTAPSTNFATARKRKCMLVQKK